MEGDEGMQVSGEFVFDCTRQELWDLLTDASALKRCTPGCEEMTPEGPDQYLVRMNLGIAAIKGTYHGKLTISDQQEPTAMTMRIETTGAGGFANVGGRLDLTEQGDAAKLVYDWDVQVGGPLAMAGQRILGGVAKWVVGQFFAAAQKELAARKAG